MTNQKPHSIVPVFGGQGVAVDAPHVLERARCDASSSYGALLLSACHEALHHELASLPPDELPCTKMVLADFGTPDALLAVPQYQYSHNPIISCTRLFLLQMLRYLTFAESSRSQAKPRTSLDEILQENAKSGIGVLGFSSGIIPACVVASSSSAVQFIANAVQAYRLAFWVGYRILRHRSSVLEKRGLPDDCALPWSSVFRGISKALALEQIAKGTTEDGSLFVTATLRNDCVTISGFPDCVATLPNILKASSLTHIPTTLDGLYHTHSHSQTRNVVLSDILRRKIHFPDFSDLNLPVRSSLTGGVIDAQTSAGSLAEAVVDMLLVHPVNWDLITREVLDSRNAPFPICFVNVGPGSGLVRSMAKAFPPGRVAIIDLTVTDAPPPSPRQVPYRQDPIAIVGMAVNVPGARNSSELWELLMAGMDTITEIPEHRFKVSAYNNLKFSKPGRSMEASRGNFIKNIDEFDNGFFRISPREARSMDPQQRLLLHTAYEALENAGYVPNATPSFQQATFGCYVGAATHDYVQNLRDEIDVHYSSGTLKAFLSGRISHVMGFSGPSIVVDTACSSSSVALYQACRAIVHGDCNAALVGGVNAITSPDIYIGLDRGHLLSPTGQCKPFDASADGYSRSEGCVMFVIKRLSDAYAENDNVLGIIRGIEINQSGNASSITHPHFSTQKMLFETLLRNSSIGSHRVNVIEAHGTGTQAGDTTEVASIRSVFGVERERSNPLYITSIKANIGHLEAASGAASLAKLLLMLQHRTIPKQILLQNLNPGIAPLESDNTIIPINRVCWLPSQAGMTRMAVINNFGAAGSNSALLLEEPGPRPFHCPPRLHHVFAVSAKTEQSLKDLVSKYVKWLHSPTSSTALLPSIAYTMTARRQAYRYRMAVSAANKTELIDKLSRSPSNQVTARAAEIAFVFSGQGGQYLGMGRSLYRTHSTFRDIIDQCHSILVDLGFPGILHIIDSTDAGGNPEPEYECFQSAIVALQYALARLWMTWGLSPRLLIGVSLGEYAALVIANVISLESALALVATRARLMQQKCQPNFTGMLAVNASSSTVQSQLSTSVSFTGLSIACFNGPTDCVVAGPISRLLEFKDLLDREVGCWNMMLSLPFGFHSHAMQPLLDDFHQFARRTVCSAPAIPIASTVTGNIVIPGDSSVFDSNYFVRHCLDPVLFDRALNASTSSASGLHINTWIEIGPHATMTPLLKRHLTSTISFESRTLASMRRDQDPWLTLTTSLSELYVANARVHWREVFSHVPTVSCVELPSYPFLNNKFWVTFQESPKTGCSIFDMQMTDPDTNHRIPTSWLQHPSPSNDNVAIFDTPVSGMANAMQGHKVAGSPLCPASVYLNQVYGGIELTKRQMFDDDAVYFRLMSIEFTNPLVYDPHVSRSVRTHITLDIDRESFTITSVPHPSTESIVHAQGRLCSRSISEMEARFSGILPTLVDQILNLTRPDNREQLQHFSSQTVYDVILTRVVEYSQRYRTIQSIAVSADGTEAYATAKLHGQQRHIADPAFLDTLLHAAGLVANLQGDSQDVFICSGIDSVEVFPDPVDDIDSFGVYCRCSWTQDQGLMIAEAYAVQLALPWKIRAHMKGMRFRRVRLEGLRRGLSLVGGVSHWHGSTPPSSLPRQFPPRQQNGYVPTPSDEAVDRLQAEILRVVSDTCHINVAQNRHLDLASLGIDSLLTIELVQNLRSALPGTIIHPHYFLSSRSIDDILTDISAGPPSPSSTFSQISSVASSPKTLVNDDTILQQNISKVGHQSNAKEVLATVLGLDISELDDDADFESLGLDSLASMEAIYELEKGFSLSLSRDFFTKCPTVRSVNDFLESHHRLGHVDGPRSTPQSTVETGVLRRQSLVSIQSYDHADDVPLLLVHDGSGLINSYNRLPPLHRNVWAIRDPAVTTGAKWDSLYEMATAYADYALEAIPGPLIVGGWSFGGVVAFEMARILLAKGVMVKGVLLIDSPSPCHHVPLPDELIDYIVNLDGRSACFDTTAMLKTQFRRNSHLLASYNPPPNMTPSIAIVLLQSSEGFRHSNLRVPEWLSDRTDLERLRRDWEAVVGSAIRVLSIPGNHFEPFDKLHLTDTALRIIEGCEHLANS